MMNIGMEAETLEYRKSTGELKEAAIPIAFILDHPEIEPRSGDPINEQIAETHPDIASEPDNTYTSARIGQQAA